MTLKNYSKKNEVLASILVSIIILSENLINLSSMLFGSSAIAKIAFILFTVLALLCFGKKIKTNDIFLIFILLLCFLLSVVFNNNDYVKTYFSYFVIYGLAGFALSYCTINEKLIYKYCSAFGLAWLLIYFIKNKFVVNDSFSFGYLIFPIVILAFLNFKVNAKNKKLRSLLLIYFIALSVILILYSSRGPVVSVLLFFIVYSLSTPKSKTALILLALSFIILINYKEIIIYLHDDLQLDWEFINKSYYLETNKGDMTNGRNEIITTIFSNYNISDFVFGVGIGGYASQTNGNYTHNIFLSFILEFGILGIAALIFVLYKTFKLVYKKKNNYIALLFSISFIPLFFSGLFWNKFQFWLYVFYMNKISSGFVEND